MVILVKVNDSEEVIAEMTRQLKINSKGNTIVMSLNILHALLHGRTITPDMLPSFVVSGPCESIPYNCPQCGYNLTDPKPCTHCKV
jgi:rubrerythrin